MSAVTARPRRFASLMSDVPIYVVVLSLLVYSNVINIDSFAISIFTAIVLKLLLDILVAAEHRASEFFERRDRALSKVLRVVSLPADPLLQ